uniref:Uncharacterized protein n=1 Tax=Aegilops tauschii TaxID=37682 RepID=M8B9B8_AEGTA
MVQEFQMQVPQGNSQAIHFSGTPFPHAGTSSPVQSFPVQQSQPHQMPQQAHMFGNTQHSHIRGANQSSPQHQAYARLAKERHIQQSMMSQQQHPLSAASAVPTVQNGSQTQPQSAVNAVPSSQSQHKKQHPTQHPQDSSVPPNQPANSTSHKQKKQQAQQQSRQNQQQRHQGSQQAKLMKSLGRGNMTQQNPSVDGTQLSGIPATSKNQVSDTNMMQQAPAYFTDIGNQGSIQGSPNQTLLASQQAPVHSSSQLATQQQQQQRHMNPSHNNIQRLMMQQNRHMNSDVRIELPVDQVNQDSSQDPTAVASTSQLASSPQDSFVGNEAFLSAPNQGMLQRQMSGGVPIHGNVIGTQRQQQQARLQLQTQQQQQQQQQRPDVQGSLYAHPSNSGAG